MNTGKIASSPPAGSRRPCSCMSACSSVVAGGQAFVNLGSSPTKVAARARQPRWYGRLGRRLPRAARLRRLPRLRAWATAKLGGGLLGRHRACRRGDLRGASVSPPGASSTRSSSAPGTAWAHSWRPRSPTSTRPSTSAAGSCPPSSCSPPGPRVDFRRGACSAGARSRSHFSPSPAAAAPTNSLAENTVLLWFIWIVWASISLARSERAPAGTVAVA